MIKSLMCYIRVMLFFLKVHFSSCKCSRFLKLQYTCRDVEKVGNSYKNFI